MYQSDWFSLTELEQKIELSLRQSDVNSKSKKKAWQLRKRSNANQEEVSDLDLAKKKRKTETLVTEKESEEEEMVYSSSESPESSEEDNEITIQPQHARLTTRVGFNWKTSDSVTVNHSGSDSSDESEALDENVEVHSPRKHAHTHAPTSAHTHAHTHRVVNLINICSRYQQKREQRDRSELIN